MIQELFGGGAAGLINGERKISMAGCFEASPTPSPTLSPSPSPTTTTTTPTNTSDHQNLRCPRCDSSNTKFCYYNNYNLTQPRHFCKTCRRYWTKGGALRNVPIGGGCRKNKPASIATASVGKPVSSGKLKTMLSAEIGKSGLVSGGFENEFAPNTMLWGGQPQTSHLLALLRATQNPNPSFGSNMIGSNMINSETRNLGFDPMGQNPSTGGVCNSFWRNGQTLSQLNQHDQLQQNGGLLLGEVQDQGMFQRFRSTPATNYYHPDHTPMIMGNIATSLSSTTSSTILESSPVASGEMGFWNPTLSRSDLPTANGAYP